MTTALDIFRALADPTRLRILALLRSMELSVGELAQVLGQSQPRVSRHVKILCDARLAERRKEGSWVFLALGEGDRVAPVADALDAWNAAEPDRWAIADAARLAAVRADRAAAAAGWFETHAGEWDAIRSLHIAESEVEAAMTAMIDAELKDGAPVARLIDIGTGTGRMLELFADRAETALGIDRSSEMLRLARAKLSEAGLANAELRQADLYALPLADGAADVAILHHVLHFAQQPGAAIAEAARVLGPDGRLLIADFAPHDREDLRTKDAHTRLGFSDAQITGWFDAAGLMPVRNETLEGGELTVKLWLGRKPVSSDIERGAGELRRGGGMTAPVDRAETALAGGAPLYADVAGDIDVSFEFFPPKTEKMEQTLWSSIETLAPLGPRFFAVTYGAGGSTRERTHATVARIASETNTPAAAHLTCVDASREEIDAIARGYWAAGVRHIVALRGDPPRAGERFAARPDGYANAAGLVEGLQRVAPFEISVAAFPEMHPDSPSLQADLDNLKAKADAGATRATTQFFFEPDTFFRFRDRAAAAGIAMEILPGIMPVTNFAAVTRMAAMNNTAVPRWMGRLFEGLDDLPDARQLVAATLAAELCRKLYAGGVKQFHFYTLNRAELSFAICHLLGARAKAD